MRNWEQVWNIVERTFVIIWFFLFIAVERKPLQFEPPTVPSTAAHSQWYLIHFMMAGACTVFGVALPMWPSLKTLIRMRLSLLPPVDLAGLDYRISVKSCHTYYYCLISYHGFILHERFLHNTCSSVYELTHCFIHLHGFRWTCASALGFSNQNSHVK